METPKITEKRIKEYLSIGKRFDGRELSDFRKIKIEKDISKKAESSVKVTLGKTEVLVGIKIDLATPYPDSPNKGNLMVTAELLPLSSSRFESGPPKFPAIELGRLVDRAIRESKFIKMEELCIKEGEKVWNIFIDVYPINDDGNLLDAAEIGAVIALKSAKIPKYDEENEKIIYGEYSEKKVPLSKEIPITVTAHKIGKNILVDPTTEEEDISEMKITIGGSIEGSIFSIQKGNSKEMKVEEFHDILDLTEKVRKEIYSKIESYFN